MNDRKCRHGVPVDRYGYSPCEDCKDELLIADKERIERMNLHNAEMARATARNRGEIACDAAWWVNR